MTSFELAVICQTEPEGDDAQDALVVHSFQPEGHICQSCKELVPHKIGNHDANWRSLCRSLSASWNSDAMAAKDEDLHVWTSLRHHGYR